MQIKELKIFSNDIEGQHRFYAEVLGFECLRKSTSILEVSTRENVLVFEKRGGRRCYHFAFMISPKSLESAILYLERRSVELLRYKGEKMVHFDSGRAIYFYDMDGNIVEFIERPSLIKYRSSTVFSVDEVIKVNEIGLPVKHPLQCAERLVEEFHIEPLNRAGFNDTFCWVGDYNGVIIVVKEGRNWLPTEKAGKHYEFSIRYVDERKTVSLKFNNYRISPWPTNGNC